MTLKFGLSPEQQQILDEAKEHLDKQKDVWHAEVNEQPFFMKQYGSQIAGDRDIPASYHKSTPEMFEQSLKFKGSANDALFQAMGVDNPYDAATASKDSWRRAFQNNPWLYSQYGDDEEYGDLLGIKYDENGNPIWDEAAFDNWYDTLTGKYKLGNMFSDPDTYEYILRSEYSMPTLASYGDRLAEIFSSQGIGGEMFGTDDWFYTLDENGKPIVNQDNMDIARSGLNQLFLRNYLAANAGNQEYIDQIYPELKWLLGSEKSYSMPNIPKLTWQTDSDVPEGYNSYGYDYSGKDYDYTDYEPELGYTDIDLTNGLYMEDLPYLLDLYFGRGRTAGAWASPGSLTTVTPKYGKE